MNPKLIAYGIAALMGAGAVSGIWWHGNSHGKRAAENAYQEAVEQARKEATTIERQRQEGVNRALQDQYDEVSSINASLAADLDRLRQRPDRPSVPRDPGTECQGATGAELSGPDAAFLARLSARADELRAALKSCYIYADTLQHHARKRDGTAE